MVLIQTTLDSAQGAERIARALVGERLAACVHVLAPVDATYRWQGAIETAQEWPLAAKTTTELADRAVARIAELHPYAVPVIEWWPVSATPATLAWLIESTG